MGHDVHFLERLDRVSMPHAELALSLYRDPDLVRAILGHARLPEGDSRVAISLGDAEDGPFLIVARDGHFVTCLGEGMSTGECPVVSRSRLDAVGARHHEIRARVEVARSLAGPNGETNRLLRRLYEDGRDLSREEFIGISAFRPVMGRGLVRVYINIFAGLEAVHERYRRPEHVDEKTLRVYLGGIFALGHLALLIAMDDGHNAFAEHAEKVEAEQMWFGWPAICQGVASIALRGVWAVGKIGKLLLPTYRRGFAEAGSLRTTIEGALCLGAIAHRHAKLRGQATRVLLAAKPALGRIDTTGCFDPFLESVRVLLRKGLDNPEGAIAASRALGGKLYQSFLEGFPKADIPRFERPEEVPEDLAFAAFANTHCNYIDNGDILARMALALPWIAHRRPEDFFLPAAIVKATKEPWDTKEARGLYAAAGPPMRRQPIRAEAKPGRNEPCPCGSGKKFKKCCGP